MEKCQGRSSRFPNFIRSQRLLMIINHESFNIEFDQADFLSFIRSLRVPSETLQLVRAFSTGALEALLLIPRRRLSASA